MEKQVFEDRGQFSKAILVRCNKLFFISGEGPIDADGGIVGEGDMEAQTRQTFVNLQNRLAEVGAGFENVVKMTNFLADEKDLKAFKKVRKEFIKQDPPTATTVIVSLDAPEIMKLEIEAIAVLD